MLQKEISMSMDLPFREKRFLFVVEQKKNLIGIVFLATINYESYIENRLMIDCEENR